MSKEEVQETTVTPAEPPRPKSGLWVLGIDPGPMEQGMVYGVLDPETHTFYIDEGHTFTMRCVRDMQQLSKTKYAALQHLALQMRQVYLPDHLQRAQIVCEKQFHGTAATAYLPEFESLLLGFLYGKYNPRHIYLVRPQEVSAGLRFHRKNKKEETRALVFNQLVPDWPLDKRSQHVADALALIHHWFTVSPPDAHGTLPFSDIKYRWGLPDDFRGI